MRRRLIILLSLLLILMLCTQVLFAEERSIYVGDNIHLTIQSTILSEEDIQNEFKDFEIVSLQKADDQYDLVIRSFKPDTYKVSLGNKDITIVVSSLLDEGNENLKEPTTTPKTIQSNLILFSVLIISLAVCLVFGMILLVKWMKNNKKRVPIDPYERYGEMVMSLDISDEDVLVKMTFALKAYIEEVYDCKIKGKTTSEISGAIYDITQLNKFEIDIMNWLTACDDYKFKKKDISGEHIQPLKDGLLELFDAINKDVKSSKVEE